VKRLKIFCLLALACFGMNAFAQAAKPAATPNAPAKAASPSIASAVDQQIRILEREFVSAAEAMPDDKFNFTPVSLNIPGSEYKTVKTFAEEVRHVAATNYQLWGAITGDKSPIESK
jgi:predicted outer membrane protein